MSRPPVPRTALASLTLAALSWGLATAISKRAVAEIPPLTLLPIQLTASLVVLIALMRWRRQPIRLPPGATPLLGPLGVLNPGVSYALSLLGLVTVSASISVLVWAMEPVLILVLAAWVLHERVGWAVAALSGVAITGLVLVIGAPDGSAELGGVALTLAGVGCCAVYTVAARRWIGSVEETATVVATQQIYALGFASLLFAGLWLTGGAGVPQASATAWASALVSGVLYYGVAYWLYLSGLRLVSASIAAVSFYLIPVFGVAASFLLLGERLEPVQWVGAAVVVAAVALIMTWTGRPSEAVAPVRG